jgi:hypothetical protein
MSLNPYASEFVPLKQSQPQLTPLQQLFTYPFFQQRLERFLNTNYRIPDACVENLQILMVNPPIQPQTKATTHFLGQYNGIPLLYEADRLEDPRTGKFVKVSA